MCDIDMRPAMWGSVVVTGGATLALGWVERLGRDLAARTPSSVRLKTIAANGASERRFGAWIGNKSIILYVFSYLYKCLIDFFLFIYRWFNIGVPRFIPTNVDIFTGVRRSWKRSSGEKVSINILQK